jgi:hypothetical protein
MAQNNDATVEQIDKELVARTLGELGSKRNPYADCPETRFVNIAAWNRYDNVHRGLFIDSENPEGELLYGWTNDDRSTWKITNTGNSVNVKDVELETPNEVENATEYAQEWIEILVEEYRYDTKSGSTRPGANDEIRFDGAQILHLRDVDGRKATFKIELTND